MTTHEHFLTHAETGRLADVCRHLGFGLDEFAVEVEPATGERARHVDVARGRHAEHRQYADGPDGSWLNHFHQELARGCFGAPSFRG